jgi:hypothetical protein
MNNDAKTKVKPQNERREHNNQAKKNKEKEDAQSDEIRRLQEKNERNIHLHSESLLSSGK